VFARDHAVVEIVGAERGLLLLACILICRNSFTITIEIILIKTKISNSVVISLLIRLYSKVFFLKLKA
jgi:hypothetical protein